MQSNERKLTLLLLCWIFGLFSAHRFYTAKYVTATIHLSIFAVIGALFYFDLHPPKPLTMLIFFAVPVWVMLDLLRIISGNFTDREGRRVTQWV
jgi:uncharacterized membrane protein YGL010W